MACQHENFFPVTTGGPSRLRRQSSGERPSGTYSLLWRCESCRVHGSYQPDGLGVLLRVQGQENGRTDEDRRRGAPLDDPVWITPWDGSQFLRARLVAKWSKKLERSIPSTDNGREWTRRLISPHTLSRWVSRSHSEMSFRLIQLVTGHGYFNWFLQRIGHALSAGCYHYEPPDNHVEVEEDDILHTLVCCEAFECDWEHLVQSIGRFEPGDLVSRML